MLGLQLRLQVMLTESLGPLAVTGTCNSHKCRRCKDGKSRLGPVFMGAAAAARRLKATLGLLAVRGTCRERCDGGGAGFGGPPISAQL